MKYLVNMEFSTNNPLYREEHAEKGENALICQGLAFVPRHWHPSGM